MTDDELTAALAKAEREFRRAESRSAERRDERNRLVRAALAAGWTHARIAQVTGLTRGRINQLR